jgi:predicted ATPase
VEPGALIGRARELTEVETRGRAARLVTIVGPGGVGKTALARAAGNNLAPGFPLGVRHVDLTRIDDPRSVQGAIAAQLGFDSFDALLGSPTDHPVLLIVDNCEHLLDAAADALVRVLGTCQQPSVIATSRAPLELPGESIVSLAPLPLPTDDDPVGNPSVELFLARCRESGSELDDPDLPAVVGLCRQLDGLPLALEIAAARTRTMSVAEISKRLAESVDVLARPRFRGDPRHRSLADTIGWSYDLLGPPAAALLEMLAVFAGPFRAEAAAAVAGIADFDAALDELVTASLIVADTSGADTSYRLLDTVRRFGLDRLDQRGGTAAAYDRFVDHVNARTRQQLAGAAVRWRGDLMRDLIDSFDDIAEAVRWCIAHDSSPRRAHQLCSALWGVVHQAHADDIVELMRRVTERFPERDTRGGVHAAAVHATAEYVTGHSATALALVEPLATRAEADLPLVMVHRILGQARNAVGDRSGSIEAFRTGARIAGSLGMTAMTQELDIAAAVVTADTGDVDAALGVVRAVVDRAAEDGSELSVSWARTVCAWLLCRTDPAAAFAAAGVALDEARRVAYPIAVAVNLRTRAYARLLSDDVGGAVAVLTDLLDDLIERGALANARVLVDVTAAVAYTAGHPEAERLTATARSLPITTLPSSQFELVALPPTTAAALSRREVLSRVRGVLDDLAGAPAAPAAEPIAGLGTARVHDDVCEFDFAGRTVTVRLSKGIADIVRLLAAGGAEVPAVELAEVGVQQGSTGELLDTRARREYENRIRDLQSELEQAEDDNDYARAYRYQVELDTLVEHLTSALGRGGRSRRAADNAERARSAVTHRVRTAIRQLERVHPALANHFGHAVQTGTYCSYRPEHPVTWSVE